MPDLTEWIPVELEIVDRIWKPDTEILKLKGFNALEVLGKLQVRHYIPKSYIPSCHGIARALFRGVMRMVNSHT